MSWSITFIGKPENVAKALQDQSAKLEGQSKVEYDGALPHFIGLINENFGDNPPMLKINASGHGYAVNGEQKNRQCTCAIELWYGTIV